MRAFLNQPVEPQTGVIECMIRRKKGVMNTVYQAYYEVTHILMFVMRMLSVFVSGAVSALSPTHFRLASIRGHCITFFFFSIKFCLAAVNVNQTPCRYRTPTIGAPVRTSLLTYVTAVDEASHDGQEGQGPLYYRHEPGVPQEG